MHHWHICSFGFLLILNLTQLIIMFRIYFITAWRSLWKNKFYASINVLGLSVATAAFLLLINYVQFERNYEKYNPHADNIYRLTLD